MINLAKHTINLGTGDATTDRKEALAWVDDGFSVEVWAHGRRIVTLNPVL